jgi:hypothetical protein
MLWKFNNLFCLFIAGLLAISPVTSYGAFVIKLQPAQRNCFFETLKKGDRFDMSFVTTSEGEQAIKFWMNDPSGHRLHGVERESSSSFGFNPEAQGNYEFCFDNGVTHGPKEITFTVYGPDEHSGFGKDFEKHDGALYPCWVIHSLSMDWNNRSPSHN